MTRSLTVLFVLAMTIFLDAQTQPVSQAFKQLLEAKDMGHLAADDMSKIEQLVKAIITSTESRNQEKADTYDSIVEFMRGEGFTPQYVFFVRVGDKEAIATGRGSYRAYTTDVPFELRFSSRAKNGTYFVHKSGLLNDGFDEIIIDGRKIRMPILASWQDLR